MVLSVTHGPDWWMLCHSKVVKWESFTFYRFGKRDSEASSPEYCIFSTGLSLSVCVYVCAEDMRLALVIPL